MLIVIALTLLYSKWFRNSDEIMIIWFIPNQWNNLNLTGIGSKFTTLSFIVKQKTFGNKFNSAHIKCENLLE